MTKVSQMILVTPSGIASDNHLSLFSEKVYRKICLFSWKIQFANSIIPTFWTSENMAEILHYKSIYYGLICIGDQHKLMISLTLTFKRNFLSLL